MNNDEKSSDKDHNEVSAISKSPRKKMRPINRTAALRRQWYDYIKQQAGMEQRVTDMQFWEQLERLKQLENQKAPSPSHPTPSTLPVPPSLHPSSHPSARVWRHLRQVRQSVLNREIKRVLNNAPMEVRQIAAQLCKRKQFKSLGMRGVLELLFRLGATLEQVERERQTQAKADE